MKKRLNISSGIVAASLFCGAIFFNPFHSTVSATSTISTTSASSSTTSLPQWGGKSIRDFALQIAQNNGDNAPTSIEFVKTSRQKANWLVTHSSVDSDDSTYLVVMKGNFTLKKAFAPAGAPDPTGHTIIITINSSTGSVMDFQLNNIDYTLSQLGTPQSIQ